MKTQEHPASDDDVVVKYLDGTLSLDEHRRMDTHLNECTDCKQRVYAFQQDRDQSSTDTSLYGALGPDFKDANNL